jgi:hypothetical protein
MVAWATAVPGAAGHPGRADAWLCVLTAVFVDGRGSRRTAAVELGQSWRSSCIRLQILVPSARRYGSTLAAASEMVAGSTPSSSAHCSSGAAIGRPKSGSCQVPNQQLSNDCSSCWVVCARP